MYLQLQKSPLAWWPQWQFWQLGWQGWLLTRHLQPPEMSPRPCKIQPKKKSNKQLRHMRKLFWKPTLFTQMFLHLGPSELVWWPSRFLSCTSNSRSNHSHLFSGQRCHTGDTSWPPHSVACSVWDTEKPSKMQREVPQREMQLSSQSAVKY